MSAGKPEAERKETQANMSTVNLMYLMLAKTWLDEPGLMLARRPEALLAGLLCGLLLYTMRLGGSVLAKPVVRGDGTIEQEHDIEPDMGHARLLLKPAAGHELVLVVFAKLGAELQVLQAHRRTLAMGSKLRSVLEAASQRRFQAACRASFADSCKRIWSRNAARFWPALEANSRRTSPKTSCARAWKGCLASTKGWHSRRTASRTAARTRPPCAALAWATGHAAARKLSVSGVFSSPAKAATLGAETMVT